MDRKERQIRRYMLSIIEEHRDPRTGEVNCTHLAEDAIDCSGLEFTCEEEELVYDWAFEVAEG